MTAPEENAVKFIMETLQTLNKKFDTFQGDMSIVKTDIALIKKDLGALQKEDADTAKKLDKHEEALYGKDPNKGGLLQMFAELKRDATPWLNRGHRLTDFLVGALFISAIVFFAYIQRGGGN